MNSSDVVFEAGFRGEVFSACLIFRIEVCECWVGGEVECAADVALAIVHDTDMCIEITLLGERLVAVGVGARDILAV